MIQAIEESVGMFMKIDNVEKQEDSTTSDGNELNGTEENYDSDAMVDDIDDKDNEDEDEMNADIEEMDSEANTPLANVKIDCTLPSSSTINTSDTAPKTPSKKNFSRGNWTPEEDELLRAGTKISSLKILKQKYLHTTIRSRSSTRRKMLEEDI